MPKDPVGLINAGIEVTKEVSNGIEQGSAITNTMKQVANVASGKFVIDALEVVPPVNYGLTLFGNAVESSTKFVAEPLVSASFSYAVRKMVRNAATSYYASSITKGVVSSAVRYGLSFISSDLANSSIARDVSKYVLNQTEEAFIDYASSKIIEALAPLVKSYGSDFLASKAKNIAQDSLKSYLGNMLLLYTTSAMLSLFDDEMVASAKTTVNYVQDLDNTSYCFIILMMAVMVHLSPVLYRSLVSGANKEHLKSELTDYLLEKVQDTTSSINTKSEVLRFIVKAVASGIVDSNLINSDQLQLALNSVKLGEHLYSSSSSVPYTS
ncbi:MAG: hypothetical protein P4L79_12655 [Legionella sp.]|uniref:hypothetical protein n=1 Tax=Legionella sp. TaxID=459 RepID=UPI00284D45AE|nr:hypothetical protein [Legionella sp.]